MSVAHTTVRVGEDSMLREDAFVGRSGQPVARVSLGAQHEEVGVYGSARAIRRLGRAMLAAADAADKLSPRREPTGAVG